jgi:anthranilate/para-aminobenzoate synthase component II
MSSIYLFDFDDSFTYNIASELKELGADVKIVDLHHADEALTIVSSEQNKTSVIFGPGPGHPEEYGFVYPYLGTMLNNPNLFISGVCLGHQMIWNYMGVDVVHAKKPVHGQTINIQLTPTWRKYLGSTSNSQKVQIYNSLIVDVPNKKNQDYGGRKWDFLFYNNELMASRTDRILTYQFHPESIGTSYPSLFLKPILEFLL